MMLERKIQETMSEKESRAGEMPENCILSRCWRQKAARAKARAKYQIGQDQRGASGGDVTLKGLHLVQETVLEQVSEKQGAAKEKELVITSPNLLYLLLPHQRV